MTSRRSERLVNLTMALLATKRYLTKSEIFRSVEGYDGSDESKERMFERDKDALRSLGIKIDVRGVDPTFDDEQGYRILPESYSLNLGDLSGSEVAVLSLAAEAWRGAALSESANSALIKLRSLGIPSDFSAIPLIAPKVGVTSENFRPITQAILDRNPIIFEYIADNLVAERRYVDPYGLGSRRGNWYLVGLDRDRGATRTFRFDRIHGSVERESRGKFLQRDQGEIDGFDILSYLDSNLFEAKYEAILQIRRGKGFALTRDAELISADEEWEEYRVNYVNESRILDEILWHGHDVVVIEPIHLRAKVIESLSMIASQHV